LAGGYRERDVVDSDRFAVSLGEIRYFNHLCPISIFYLVDYL
jgi:hypothetical protein